jgi:ubiquinone/menaquinone biosynthesis C-methylase UbiE
MKTPKLKMLPIREYVGVNRDDPIRFYTVPIIGGLYRRRIELCLGELRGGESVLEIGFGSGVTFLNLHDMYREIYGLDLTADAEKVKKFFYRRSIETYLQNGNILQMPYEDNFFDAVLLISILEHLRPEELTKAFREIRRILKPGGQVVYGVPIERPLMVLMFRLLRTNIREHHFSTEKDVFTAACDEFKINRLLKLRDPFRLFGPIYQVGHFIKNDWNVRE